MREVTIAGASGLIGQHLLQLLLDDNDTESITLLLRKPIATNSSKIIQRIVDFNDPQSVQEAINGDTFFSCTGTTRAKTPDKQSYINIEREMPLMLAGAAAKRKISAFHFISSIGANTNSPTLYLQLKGEVERQLQSVGFSTLYIYQPSLLVGKRKEFRFVEVVSGILMYLINPLLFGKYKKYRSINAITVASAMFNNYKKPLTGTFILTSNEIKNLA